MEDIGGFEENAAQLENKMKRETTEDSPLNSLEREEERDVLAYFLIGSTIALAAGVTIGLIVSINVGPPQIKPTGAIVGPNQQCNDIGMKVLSKYGKGQDVLVAVMFCLMVTEPWAVGLTSGGQFLVHDHKRTEAKFYNFDAQAPNDLGDATPDWNDHESLDNYGVTGFVKALNKIHREHGKLPWGELVQPSIDLATQGFAFSAAAGKAFESLKKGGDCPNLGSLVDSAFCMDDKLRKVNETLQNPAMASVLHSIATENNDALLHSGGMMKSILDLLKKAGTRYSEKDFNDYTVHVAKPHDSAIHGYQMLFPPAPGAGPAVAEALGVLSQLNVKLTDDAITWHYISEATKFALADLSCLGAYDETADKHDEYRMLNETRWKELAALIRPNTTLPIKEYSNLCENSSPTQYSTKPPVSGETQVSIIDSDELFIAATVSMGDAFGTRKFTDSGKVSGVLLNNLLLRFGSKDDPANQIASKQRPRSTAVPFVIHKPRSCDIRAAVSATGDREGVAALIDVIVRLILFKQDPDVAVSAPRWYYDFNKKQLNYDQTPTPDLIKEMITLSRPVDKIVQAPSSIGLVQIVEKSNDHSTLTSNPDSGRYPAHGRLLQ